MLLSACNQAELAESNHQKDSLMMVVNERDASINDFVVAFNDVEQNLDSVAVRQHLISLTTDKPGELKPNQRARINEEILAINSLMDENRKKLDSQTRRFARSFSIENAPRRLAYLYNRRKKGRAVYRFRKSPFRSMKCKIGERAACQKYRPRQNLKKQFVASRTSNSTSLGIEPARRPSSLSP